MSARIHSAQVASLTADIIHVEVDVSRGLKSFSLVGLPDSAVKEAKERITAAIKNSGFESPQKGNKKIIVSLAPADLKKEGAVFDVAIALANLLALEQIEFEPVDKLFLGELGLAGNIRPIKGALLIAQKACAAGFRELYLPVENAAEAALIPGITVFGTDHLRNIVEHLAGRQKISATPHEIPATKHRQTSVDFADIKGQETAKRGLEIAAAGGHNIAMYGPPGTGKTMLARACGGIIPPLSLEEMLEVTGIHSAAGNLAGKLVVDPPIRTPHHTASYVSIVGGGAWPKPGEITLAHRGILFLDEFPEFEGRVIESLRQPLEDRVVSVTRAKGSVQFPAHFMLIATMNPCPCGFRGSNKQECICPPAAISKYARKLSGPIMDRIDLVVDVPHVDHEKLLDQKREPENSDTVRGRVLNARAIQSKRFIGNTVRMNSQMGVREIKKYAPLDHETSQLLLQAANRMNLSARAHHRIIKIARTIADLAGKEAIELSHMLEALTYRPKTTL